MNLVKWMRKNNQKIMAVVVVLIMVGFVGGYGLQQYLSRVGMGSGGKVGTFSGSKSITRLDRNGAVEELKMLQALYAPQLLRYRQTGYGGPDIPARLLGYLIFPDSQAGAAISIELNQAIARRQLNASAQQIDDFFKQEQLPADICWILLKNEARQNGCAVSVDRVRQTLKVIIPQITGQMFGQQVSASQVVNGVMNKFGISEDNLMGVFGDLLAVMTYAEVVTNSEDVTTGQLRAITGLNRETINAELVKFNAEIFVDEIADPNKLPLQEQFDKYKTYRPGMPDDENPYGFGYKLPDRVMLDYLIVRNEDVKEQVRTPSAAEKEQYYTTNIEGYSEDVKIDPNNPDSETVKQPKSYAEVAGRVEREMINERTENLANLIIADALELADKPFSGIDREKGTSEDYKKSAAVYSEIAAAMLKKHKVKVYSGRTGWLSAADLAADRNLGMMSLEGQSQIPAQLVKIAFAVEELGATSMGRFEPAAPKMWNNIGPLKPRYGSLWAIARVVDVAKSEVPQDINVRYSTRNSDISELAEGEPELSVKDNVLSDAKKLQAMQIAKQRAEEFARLLGDNKWEEAIDAYNKAHDKTATGDTLPGPQKLRSEKVANQHRTPNEELAKTRQLLADNPMAARYVRSMVESKMLNDVLYGLIAAGTAAANDINRMIEFKPGAGYYVVKDVSRTEVTKEDYVQFKPILAFQTDAVNSGSLAVVHFAPDNIIKRLGFEWMPDTGGARLMQTDELPIEEE